MRLAWCGPEVELESLINAKSGACPEDCAFCSQSVRFHTGVDVFAFLDLDEILEAAARDAARRDRSSASSSPCAVPRSACCGASSTPSARCSSETGLEVACSLGLLQPEQAERLAAAGVAPLQPQPRSVPGAVPDNLHDAHLRRPRRDRSARDDAGMELCCGGILGMGETLEQRIDFAFELAELDPCEVADQPARPASGYAARRHDTLHRAAKRCRRSHCSG